MEWPDWSEWDIEITPHLRGECWIVLSPKRICAICWNRPPTSELQPTMVRFVIACRHYGENWEVVVEPDEQDLMLVVITAYRPGEGGS